MNKETRKTLVSIGLLPQTVDKIDIMRGDVPRSTYLRKIIEEVASNAKTTAQAV